MNRGIMRSTVLLALALLGPACTCGGPPDVEPELPFAVVTAAVRGDTATISLTRAQRPLRSLQVDVSVAGGRASAIAAVASHDIVEGGLADGPKNELTAVIADTRRLPLVDGPVLRLTVDDGARVALRNAVAVDDQGARHDIAVGVTP
jgi:hypothetical protein